MATRSNVLQISGTVMGAGTPSVIPLGGPNGTAYFMLQKGVIGNISNFAVTVAILNGTAAAAGTVGQISIGSAGVSPFDFTAPGAAYSGAKIDQPGGMALKYTNASGGTAGTISGYAVIKDVIP